MATVINVPEDKRLSSLGRGLGEFFSARRKKEEEEEQRQKFIDAITITKEIARNPEPTTVEQFSTLSTALISAGQEDKITDFTNLLANLKSQQAKQNTLSISQEAARSVAAGETEAALKIPDITLTQQQQVASIQATLKPREAKKTQREVKVFNDKGEEREVLVPSTLDDAAVTAFVQENHPGFSRTKPAKKDKPESARAETEVERDINAILTLRKMEVNANNQAKARNLLRGRKPVNRELAARVGGNIIEDKFGNISKIDFTGADAERKRTIYSIGSAMVDDLLIQGVDQNDAVGQIEVEANKVFTTGAWISKKFTEAGPEGVTKFLESRNINAPEIVQYFTDLQNIQTDPEGYRRVLEINNPDAGIEDIVNLVKSRFPNWVPKEK